MDPNKKKADRQQQTHRLIPADLLSYISALCLAVPVGAFAWFEAVYLFFGLSGEDPPEVYSSLAAVVAFGLAFGWPLFRACRPAQVVRRACYLGLLVSGLLPVVAIAVMIVWQRAAVRPDLGMGGMMIHALPFVAIGVAVVLGVVFGLGIRLAGRRLQGWLPTEESIM